MLPSILKTKGCITVRQLKAWVKDLPEVNALGEDTEVWLDNGDGTSSECKELCPLNVRDKGSRLESCDVLLVKRIR